MTSTAKSHFVFATNAPFSHVPQAINLIVASLTFTPDLYFSVILHKNNEDNARRLISLAPMGVSERVRLWLVGEITLAKDVVKNTMDMAYKAGEAYAGILAVGACLLSCDETS